MFASIIHHPRQLLLAAFMAITLSASTLGALGFPNLASAHTPNGTGYCGTTNLATATYVNQHDHGPVYEPFLKRWYNYNEHHWTLVDGSPHAELCDVVFL